MSAGLMYFLQSVLAGIDDAGPLTAIVLANFFLQWIGYKAEKAKAENRMEMAKALEVAGYGIFFVQWTMIFSSFLTAVTAGTRADNCDIPSWVYAIIFVLFALFISFGIWSSLYKTKVQSFVTMEYGYGVLSLVAKSVLAWTVVGGLQNAGRSQNDCV